MAQTGRRLKLTPEVQTTIVQEIADGTFDWVAAEAAGVCQATFYRWLAEGEAGKAPFLEFLEQVRQAKAKARSRAERRVAAATPFAWLRYGPGRERPGQPGWTESSKQEISTTVTGQVTVKHEFDYSAYGAVFGELLRGVSAEPALAAGDGVRESLDSPHPNGTAGVLSGGPPP